MSLPLPLQFNINWIIPSILTFQIIPRTLGFLWIRNDKRKMPCGIENLACVGPTSSICLHDQLPLLFYIVFIYLSPLLNVYAIIMFKHHLFPPYSISQSFHTEPRKLVIFLLGNYLTLSINLTKSHEYGKCD